MILSETDLSRFHSRRQPGSINKCWNWTGHISPKGYGQFWIQGMTENAHRIAWIIENGPISGGLFVCHKCDNPACCNPNHLFLGTALENNRDRARKGRSFKRVGTLHPLHKLNDCDIPTIFLLRKDGLTHSAIADRFSVNREAISKILRRERWSHIEIPL